MAEPLPPLPSSGFVSGRLATEDDVKSGNAVFFIVDDEVRPYSMTIPQFVLWREDDGGPSKICVVVQAEQTLRGVTVGMRDLNGNEIIATLEELDFMGEE